MGVKAERTSGRIRQSWKRTVAVDGLVHAVLDLSSGYHATSWDGREEVPTCPGRRGRLEATERWVAACPKESVSAATGRPARSGEGGRVKRGPGPCISRRRHRAGRIGFGSTPASGRA